MMKFISGFIIGAVACFCFLRFDQVQQTFENIYKNVVHEYRPKSKKPVKTVPVAEIIPEIKNETLPPKKDAVENKKTETPVLFKKLIDDKKTQNQDEAPQHTVMQTQVEQQKETAPQELPGLLETLRKDGKLNYMQDYKVAGNEQDLYTQYQEIQKDYDQKTRGQQLSMAEIKEYRNNYETRLNALVAQYEISTNHLDEFVKYMRRL